MTEAKREPAASGGRRDAKFEQLAQKRRGCPTSKIHGYDIPLALPDGAALEPRCGDDPRDPSGQGAAGDKGGRTSERVELHQTVFHT